MNPKQFQKYLDRDGYCLHCGETNAIAPHHRANRGMGGSKTRDVPSNIIVICSNFNGSMEANHYDSATGRVNGWKLSAWHDPKTEPVFDAVKGEWFLLDDNFNRTQIRREN
jgi:hypothetical protein